MCLTITSRDAPPKTELASRKEVTHQEENQHLTGEASLPKRHRGAPEGLGWAEERVSVPHTE